MISIYLDWNVIVQMKNGLHHELRTILESKRFFIPYSSSHIGDILSGYNNKPGQRELVDIDLKLLSELTENNCLNDGKEIKREQFLPQKLFEKATKEKDLFRDFSFSKLKENALRA